MPKFLTFFASISISLLLSFLSTFALAKEDEDESSDIVDQILESLYVFPSADVQVFDGRRNLDATPHGSAVVGLQFTQLWSAEIGGGYGSGKKENSREYVDIFSFRGDLVRDFNLDSLFRPYLVLGYRSLKGLPVGQDESYFGAGFGIKSYFNEQWAIRGDIRAYDAVDSELIDGVARIGIHYNFDFRDPIPPDTDKDGVIDLRDACPGTPFGAPVDELGCALDTDQDTVIDLYDECPETPLGAPIDAVGCALDTDRDTVIDLYDECPGTPFGAPIDAVGCALDTDRDGVIDLYDECPGTPYGAKVDEVGCRIILTEVISLTLNVTFEFDSFDLTPESIPEVEKVYDFLTSYPDTKVVLEGHTDSRGSNRYNKRLSQQRADAVANTLVERFNVDPTRIETIGYGEVRPIATNDTEEGREINRRVVSVIETTVESYEKKENVE